MNHQLELERRKDKLPGGPVDDFDFVDCREKHEPDYAEELERRTNARARRRIHDTNLHG
jgi:hypothetical protein